MPRSTKRGGRRPGAGRPRLAEGRTRRIEITLGEADVDTLERLADECEKRVPPKLILSPQAAIRYLISQERARRG